LRMDVHYLCSKQDNCPQVRGTPTSSHKWLLNCTVPIHISTQARNQSYCLIFSYESMIQSNTHFTLPYLSFNVCSMIATNVIPAKAFPMGRSRVNTARSAASSASLSAIRSRNPVSPARSAQKCNRRSAPPPCWLH
jgi:hypothetical protein